MTKPKPATTDRKAKPGLSATALSFSQLSKSQQDEVSRMSQKVRDKNPAIKFRASVDPDGGVKHRSNMPDSTFDGLALCDILGTHSEALAERFVQQIKDTSTEIKNDKNKAAGLASGLGFIQGVAPQNEIEATLAIQMHAIHNLMMSVARRSETAEFPDAIQFWFNQASKLARTYTAQIETLTKLRGGGQQNVTVTHTHIDARGSQNVITDTVTTGGGVAGQTQGQPHAQALAYQPGTPCAPLRSPDADGVSVQGAGDQG